MPNLEEHCEHTLERYRIEGRDIHQWMDEPCRRYGKFHRRFRHDDEAIKLVGEIFGKTYGKSLAENIALDHIVADHEESKNRRKDDELKIQRFTKAELEEFYSQPPTSFAWKLWLELHYRRKLKKTFWGTTWFPLNANSSFWDCEVCGEKRLFRLKTVILQLCPRFQFDWVRVCLKCKNKLMGDKRILLLNK